MVYHGPSRGCAECKKRRVRCDEQSPECQNCLRRRIHCTGARPKIEFLDETTTVTRSQQAQNSKISRRSSSTANKNDARSQSPRAIGLASTDNIYPTASSLFQSPEGSAYDPFGAFAIRVDANIHDVLLFWHSCVEAPIREEQLANQPLQHLTSKAWGLTIRSMRNETLAYSLLLLAASLKSRITACERMTRLSLEWHTLRHVLIPRAEVSLLVTLVGALLGAELTMRNFAAATFHAAFLFRYLWPNFLVFAVGGQVADHVTPSGLNMASCLNMLTTTRTNFSITPRDIHTSLLMELQRAVSMFTKPMIDFQFIALERMNLHGSSTFYLVEPFSALDLEAFTDLHLLQHFEDIRIHIGGLFKPTLTPCDLSRTYCVQISTRILLLTSRLLEYGIAASDNAHSSASQVTRHFDHCQNAAASLAALYWVRLITRNEAHRTGNGLAALSEGVYGLGPQLALQMARLLEASTSTTQKLTDSMGRMDASSPGHALLPSLRLRLWILNVGSFIESVCEQDTSKLDGYHYKEYQSMLNALGLNEKSEFINDILQAFLPLHGNNIRQPVWLSPILRTFGLSDIA